MDISSDLDNISGYIRPRTARIPSRALLHPGSYVSDHFWPLRITRRIDTSTP